MKIRFIINPIAGNNNRVEEIKKSARRLFSSTESIFEFRITGKKGDAFSFSKEAKDMGYDIVIACGGDGTINEVASALAFSNTTLGIIPTGSGNGLARALTIPANTEEAINLVISGKIREIDIGVICGRYFFSTAGVGFDALLSKRYNERTNPNIHRGIFPYIPITLKEYFKYKPGTTLIRWNDKQMSTQPFLLTIANTEQFGSNAIVAPGAKPDDGLLDVCIIPKLGLFDTMIGFLKLFQGKINTMKGYKRLRTASLEILRDSPGLIHVDGEPFEEGKRIEIRTLPKSLKVFASHGEHMGSNLYY